MGIADWSPEVLVQGPLEQSVVSGSCMAKPLLVSQCNVAVTLLVGMTVRCV